MNSVDVCEGRYIDLVYIARRMREIDAQEIWPVTFASTPEDLASGIVHGKVYKFLERYNGLPVSAWGATLSRPGVVGVWMFATDLWSKVALTVTRHIRKDLMLRLIEDDLVRAECWSSSDHHTAHKWLNILGAVKDAELEDYGLNRVPYYCFSWTRTRLKKEGKFDVYRSTSFKATADDNATSTTNAGSSATSTNAR